MDLPNYDSYKELDLSAKLGRREEKKKARSFAILLLYKSIVNSFRPMKSQTQASRRKPCCLTTQPQSQAWLSTTEGQKPKLNRWVLPFSETTDLHNGHVQLPRRKENLPIC
ncbi:hypothetical protein AVEN_66056-1 [Araneus ventricosus]|uniref:Uncharacterized protein n=1 Tax=Araneus ventricosus TaxID=182803 RepID=A0A4Y2P908_ARAVE|nr:hypothetical protein AVEN_66056-1 [Araneus ventricosus]